MNTFDERTERNIATLHPKAQELARKFMSLAVPAMRDHGLDIRIIGGSRTYAEQDALEAQRPRVTRAKGGYSLHNFGIAFDIGLFCGKTYLDESVHYAECGRIGQSVGLEWGGSWKSFQDEPHFQVPTGLTLAQMRERVAQGKSVL